jgi:hypothetical protein
MREVVRSGRRANFYMTENSFIDHYAGDVGTTGVAVYHVLQRHANCETHSTWIGTAKMAKLLNLEQRTIQRTIKKLESLRLIRVVRSENMTTFYIDPVPPRAKTTSTPLFDQMPEPPTDQGDTNVASTTPMSRPATVMSPDTTSPSRGATFMSRANDTHVGPYKEEQDLSNKTFKQDNPLAKEIVERLIQILKLPTALTSSVMAAVEVEMSDGRGSTDTVVERIWTDARRDERRGIPIEEFFGNFLAKRCAQDIIGSLHLTKTNTLISIIAESIKAEAGFRGLSVEEAAEFIDKSALENRERGIEIDRFYFENTKWRNGNAAYKPSASQQRSKRTKQNILDGIAAEVGRRNQPHGTEQ